MSTTDPGFLQAGHGPNKAIVQARVTSHVAAPPGLPPAPSAMILSLTGAPAGPWALSLASPGQETGWEDSSSAGTACAPPPGFRQDPVAEENSSSAVHPASVRWRLFFPR